MNMNLKEDVVIALKELGSTPLQIAQSLQRLGIKGKRNVACDCPLARYLQHKFSTEAFDVTVSRVMHWEEELLSFCEYDLFSFTNFVSEFDCNTYPFLVQ